MYYFFSFNLFEITHLSGKRTSHGQEKELVLSSKVIERRNGLKCFALPAAAPYSKGSKLPGLAHASFESFSRDRFHFQ